MLWLPIRMVNKRRNKEKMYCEWIVFVEYFTNNERMKNVKKQIVVSKF